LILIEGHQGYAAIFDHLAITLSGGQFVFRKMRENFRTDHFCGDSLRLSFSSDTPSMSRAM